MHRFLALMMTAVAVAIAVWLVVDARTAEMKSAAKWSANGELMRPEGYREWIFVGSPVTPNDMNDGHAAFPEFHDVYIDRASFDQFRRTGAYPEGAVIVKELVSVGAKSASSGRGYFPGKFNGIAAAVKDTTRFGGERSGWGYFDFGLEKKMAAVELPANCNACHKAGAERDMVFDQFYPVLKAARSEKTAMPGMPEKEKEKPRTGYY